MFDQMKSALNMRNLGLCKDEAMFDSFRKTFSIHLSIFNRCPRKVIVGIMIFEIQTVWNRKRITVKTKI